MAKLWELFARLGTAVFEVLEAEVQALGSDLRGTGRKLLVFVLWLIVAAQLTVISLALIGLGVARILEVHLPAWVAALLPGVVFLLLAGGVAIWAWRGLASLEPPLTTVKRRLEDHSLWWRGEIAAAQEAELGAEPDDD